MSTTSTPTVAIDPARADPVPADPARADPARADTVHRRRWYTLAVLSLSLLVIVVDTTIVNVAIPTLADRLHAGASALEWIVDAYTLVFAALLLPAGSLGDRYGRHRALALGMAVFGTASLGAALSTTATELICWRGVMGAGAALTTPATMALLTAVFTDRAERAKAIGIWSAVSGLGVAIGPTAGGWLLAHFAWGSIFAVNLPIVAVALVAGRFLVPSSRAPHRPRFDLPGTVLATLAFGVLIYTVIDAHSAGWASGTTLLRAAVTLALLAGFGAWELHTGHPMVEPALFRMPRFTTATVAIMVLFFGLSGMTFVLTQIYQFILGYSPLAAGVRSLPSALAFTVASFTGTAVAARLGIRLTVTGGLIIAAAGLSLFSLATGSSGYAHYVAAAVAMATGMGLTMSPATQAIVNALPPAKTGIGSAVANATRNLGMVLGVAIVGSIAATRYSHDTALPEPARQSIGTAAQIIQRIADDPAARNLHASAANAFVHGAGLGVLVAAGITLLTAAAAARHLRLS